MINFTVGPVQSSEAVRKIGAENCPYFRTPEFSAVMLENEALMKEFAHAPEGARAVFMTCSGTGSMEATVMNVLNREDKAIVINGGSFGHRFVELLEFHSIPHSEIKLDFGKALTAAHLAPFDGKGYTALVINIHETSTGVRYDLPLISEFCKRNKMLLVVDAISSFLQNEFLRPVLGIDDPRTSERISFVGGIRVQQRVDAGQAAVAFSMNPVTIHEVMSIADAGEVMPPKSTWFEPKLRSGLFIHKVSS